MVINYSLMMRFYIYLLFLFISACGGGGGGAPEATQNAQNTQAISDTSGSSSSSSSSGSIGANDYVENGTSTMVNSGKVIDGYIQNARVFIDVNFDGIWAGSDEHELSAMTDSNGLYQFDSNKYNANKACYDKRPRIAIVDTNSIDLSTGPVTKPYKLIFIPNVVGVTQAYIDANDNAHTNLTPYTSVYSVLIAKAKANLIKNCSGTSNACYQLRKELNTVKTGPLLGDQCVVGSTSDKLANEIDTMGAQNAEWISTFLRTAGLPKVTQANSNQAIDPGYDFIEKNATTLAYLASESTKLLAVKESVNNSLDAYFQDVYGGNGDLVGTSVDFSQETVLSMLTPSYSLNTLNGSGLFTDDLNTDFDSNWEWKDEVTINRLKTTDYKDLVLGSCEENSSSDKCEQLDISKFSDILKSAASVQIDNSWVSPNSVTNDIDQISFIEKFTSWWGVDEECEGTCAVELDFPERKVLTTDTYHCSEQSSINFALNSNVSGNVTAIQYIDENLGCPERTDKVKRVMWNYRGDQFNYTRSNGDSASETAYDGIHIRIYEVGNNIAITFPVVDKSDRDPQDIISWIAYAKTIPNHWTEVEQVKALFVNDSDTATFSSRRLIDGKNMMYEYIVSKDSNSASGYAETCIKQDRTDYNITNENIIVERINGVGAHNACFGTFTSLK